MKYQIGYTSWLSRNWLLVESYLKTLSTALSSMTTSLEDALSLMWIPFTFSRDPSYRFRSSVIRRCASAD
uniref:Uncharacterized protein n=1 Tax=Anguilla anguilla TaxID=7936 RepID=A0A0E9UHV7_ANGAN